MTKILDKAKKEDNNQKSKSGYTAENITVLEGLEPVRKRPGMLICPNLLICLLLEDWVFILLLLGERMNYE